MSLFHNQQYFLSTPRWYSYGGMFMSIFLAVNLANHYGKRLVMFYPEKHFDGRYDYPGLLNRELRRLVVGRQLFSANSFFQKSVAVWLDFNRSICRIGVLHRIISRLCRLFRLARENVFPFYLGYTGLEDLDGVRRHLGIPESVDWGAVLATPVTIDLTEDQKHRGRAILHKMGIPAESPFVCLYVRDAGFESRRSTNRFTWENANIVNVSPAIAFLESRGFHIVRVGDPSMLPFEMEGSTFIDYVHSDHYCNVMDLYLYRHCEFWVTTGGGTQAAAVAYGRPCVVINGTDLASWAFCVYVDRGDVFLPKHVFSTQNCRFLSLQEQLEKIDILCRSKWDDRNYVFVQNTPIEICTAVKEYHSSTYEGEFDWNTDLQEQFHVLHQRRTYDSFYDPFIEEWDQPERECCAHSKPHVSKEFLENCWENTDYLAALSDHYNVHNSLEGFNPT